MLPKRGVLEIGFECSILCRLVEAPGRIPQGVRDPAGRIVPEFRPCGRLLRIVAFVGLGTALADQERKREKKERASAGMLKQPKAPRTTDRLVRFPVSSVRCFQARDGVSPAAALFF